MATENASGRQYDPFHARLAFKTASGPASIYSLEALEKAGLGRVSRLPFSVKVLLEAVLRHCDGRLVSEKDVAALAAWAPDASTRPEVPFKPARIILQDFTGVPAVVDLAALRSAMQRLGGDPAKINPLVPVDLVIDHSVQVDVFGVASALERNAEIEFARNRERYEFLKWGQRAFSNFRVVPPATGIVHQVNLEFLAKGVIARDDGSGMVLFPDTLLGTDSHTTMINGLGVLGWGVGGIEAEAAMLGQPCYLLSPRVVGVKLTGKLREGVTATDLVLTVTELLRRHGVVDKFVEFYGNGLSQMRLADRATVANMAPEYGATIGFFPIDEETLRYLRQTGRSDEEVDRVERYAKQQGLFRTDGTPDPEFSETDELDLGTVESSLAGPKRPQDRVPLTKMKTAFARALTAPVKERGFGLSPDDLARSATVGANGASTRLGHGAVVIAAITSCTNTSNPSVMVAAGLLAKKAVARGLRVPSYVKTSLAPGSKVVTEYLKAANLLEPLAKLHFNLVGYGCTTCIGNSGPLPPEVAKAVTENHLVAAAVISGNRNFEGRVHPLVRANYLASPPLVVAYALAGRVDIDLSSEPIGRDASGVPVHLRDIWPTQEEVSSAIGQAVRPEMFRKVYGNVWEGSPTWKAVPVSEGALYPWRDDSTYIQEPPFFTDLSPEPAPIADISGARVLALLGDSITTDHISPAGDIPEDGPAGRYLVEHGLAKHDFNSFGSRRGNDRVMVRGTFANIRLKNRLLPGTEGGLTLHFPGGEQMAIFDAAMRYREEGVPLMIIAGKEYGSGSSRDWAAKGTQLLGVKAVLAESYERIHRSNLLGMGVLPLQFRQGESAASLGLTGQEVFSVKGLSDRIHPRAEVTVTAKGPGGESRDFQAVARFDSEIEIDYYRNGGILTAVLRNFLKQN
ncbi:MAG TPA: aconitate hydratase AcnA [Candidatus Dormibacteraeota bacterium]|nr:aconitate hydratase AcnA [Candidatus Dormibacteraeota bacterium]